ncbi:hypothetical protein SAMN02910265_00601 [Ruminococcus flavefaciens]|uniref:Uncharacterized protein n=1 Tax=Ruminococcus flavefaciens TaxID=1265 RepID=A0A1H6I6T6_RUMFL|nr:hypothetical protein [Ruminococcus flavefaciens]SEH42409.1 hypothetical protein SAMN02910265_00601 [Ruminococcus flavefaciens]
MIERNELDFLENAEQSVIDRLTEEYPPRDFKEKEKIFSMSERKFKDRSNQTEKTTEQVVSGVEVYSRPKWQRFLSVAAAAALVIGGLGGGALAYNHFRNSESAMTDADTANKTAPFGDFAELEYQLCHYNSEPKTIYIDNETDEEGKVYFYRGKDITQEQREQIAGFLNNYDYEEISDADVLLSAINQSLKEADNEEAAGDDFKNAPSFVYESGNEIRSIDIQELDGTGILRYSCCKYTDEDGRLVAAAQDYSVNAWKIDYDLFKSTIEGILGTETKQPTTEAIEETVPFNDFFAHEITVSSDDHTNISVTTDEDYLAYVTQGRKIPSDKCEQLGELFNSLTLERKDRDPFIEDMPFHFQSLDKLDFVYLNGNELAYITLRRDSNILVYDSMHVETFNNGSNLEGYYNYKCTDEGHTRDNIKVYDINYDELAGRIREILGDDFAVETAPKNNFAFFNWKVKDDTDIYLTDNDKEALYNILNSCKWEVESMNESITNEADINADDSIVIYSEDAKMHFIVSLQTLPEYTLAEISEYRKNDSGEIIRSKTGQVYRAYDTELVQKIKSYLSGENSGDELISFSFLNDGSWGCRVNNEDVPYNQVDLYNKFKDQYGEETEATLQLVQYTNYLSDDKLMKISSLLDSKEWRLPDFEEMPSEQNGFVDFTTRTVDHFIGMHVQSGENSTTIRFSADGYGLKDMASGENANPRLEAADYVYVYKEYPYYFLSNSLWFSCDDPYLAQEIADIIAE